VSNLPTGILLENDVESLRDADSFINVFWQPNTTKNDIISASVKIDLLLTVQKHTSFFYEATDPKVLKHSTQECE